MKTHHLFYTLRMIWNHSAPAHLKLKPFKQYMFNQFYTSAYMGKAVKNIVPELLAREDLENNMVADLAFMESHFVKGSKYLVFTN